MAEFEFRGFVGDVEGVPALVALVQDVARAHAAPLQVVRGDRVWDRAHVSRAATLAARAFAEGRNRSADVAVELITYAAGDRQIARAIERLGVREGRALPLVAVAFGPRAGAALDALAARAGWRRDDGVLTTPKAEAALDELGVGPDLRASVPPEAWGGLVLERVALVDLPKA